MSEDEKKAIISAMASIAVIAAKSSFAIARVVCGNEQFIDELDEKVRRNAMLIHSILLPDSPGGGADDRDGSS